jgi:hypothetical protein
MEVLLLHPTSAYPKAELMISGGAVIHVKVGHGVDANLDIPKPRSMKGW